MTTHTTFTAAQRAATHRINGELVTLPSPERAPADAQRICYDWNQAALAPGEYRNAKGQANNQERIQTLALRSKSDPELTLAEFATYMSRSGSGASPVHCSLWLHTQTEYRTGQGKAAGYGYCKTSAAIASALQSAGVELLHDCGGAGEQAAKIAVEAAVRAMGFKDKTFWTR